MDFNGFLRKFSVSRFIFIFVLFFPKISIFPINGLEQGLRIEDLLCLVYTFYLILSGKLNNLKFNLFIVTIIFYLIFIGLFCEIYNISQNWIIIIRLVEYLIIIELILNSINNDRFIKKSLYIYIYINTLIVILQYKGILGGFASFKYLEAGSGWLERPYGLTGGPWELGLTLILSLFTLMVIKPQPNIFRIITLNICVLFCLILSATRANIVAYFLGILFFYGSRIKFKELIIITLIVSPLIITALNEFNLVNRFNDVIDFSKNISDISLENYQSYFRLDDSLKNRINHWDEPYKIWSSSILFMVFGIGWHNLYMESFLLRIIFTFGIIGVTYFVIYMRKLPLYIVVITLTAGLTLDIFLSQKIFFSFSLLYFIYMKNLDEEI